MTNEERQKLCDELSHAANRTDRHGYYGPLCGKAADEIERLAALAQSDAEPVCLWRYKGEKLWHECNEAEYHVLGDNPEDVERRLLYAAPPRPDASAGLIDAAEYAENLARASTDEGKAKCLTGFAGLLRARAAGRSGKHAREEN